jgi:hypothetical protein
MNNGTAGYTPAADLLRVNLLVFHCNNALETQHRRKNGKTSGFQRQDGYEMVQNKYENKRYYDRFCPA